MRISATFGSALVLLLVGCGAGTEFAPALPQAGAATATQALEEGIDPHQKRLLFLDRFYRHFAGQRDEPLAAMLPAGMKWHHVGWRQDVVPFAGTYEGRDAVAGYLQNYFAAIDIQEYDFQYKLSDGEWVTWHFRLVAQVPMTGKTFDAEFVHLWQFDADGNPVFVRAYYDTQLAIKAFTLGGETQLKDRRNPNDDFVVAYDKPYDVEALVSTLYDRFYMGDIAGVLPMLAQDVYIYFKGDETTQPQSGEFHGIGGALQFIFQLAGTALPYDISRFHVTEGDRTDLILFENWTVYATGKSYHVHTVNSWRVNDQGLLMGFINYPDIDEVAAAYVP